MTSGDLMHYSTEVRASKRQSLHDQVDRVASWHEETESSCQIYPSLSLSQIFRAKLSREFELAWAPWG